MLVPFPTARSIFPWQHATAPQCRRQTNGFDDETFSPFFQAEVLERHLSWTEERVQARRGWPGQNDWVLARRACAV